MAFVNEYISEEDIKKYDIEALNKKFCIADYNSKWTVDSERDIYLRYIGHGHEEFIQEHDFYMFWEGGVIDICLHVEQGGKIDGPQWRHYELIKIKIPDEISEYKANILDDLKEALTEFKSAGLFSRCSTFKATFEF